ncbi:Dam1p [Lachancea thermotolerans CBS 6340]|uniref:DASH complex subunit DAM1 n=1 Tax=Lachancea thermotolerans (strain ATCC 56472 / CBS 6340 / NRRL Y-8284) TaxID=559295 RepID=C5DJ70_LACTC|nr:KLTH0F13992p [Lachancea thermotolerans CBS 6340]CAR24359.1 KLTH0F13992p [Lachancea thermotolerans CBS 6340]
MPAPKSQVRPNTPVKDQRTATEYRLSISSNPGSRRSSLGAANNNDTSESDSVISTYLLPQVRELSDAMITLDSNFTQMNFIHESLVDLNESVSALLYGLMCNSWCVDFPNMPHDTLAELKTMQTLQKLEAERLQLVEAIARQERQDQDIKEAQSTASQHFASALRPRPQQGQKVVTGPGRRDWTSQGTAALDFNDDDNTDASFVSNPATIAPSLSKSRQMRRKSMLHTMRNSIAGTHELSESDKRRSLAVSASRIVNPSKNPTLGTTASRNIASRASTQRVAKDARALRTRPPFR